jgi:streptogramin lyase
MGELALGSVFAGHRIEAITGRGGMGVVYRARQLSLDRTVALKVIAPALIQDPDMRARFLRESRVAASIDHPHVIPVYYTGQEQGIAYIAMRFVDGDDVRTLVRREGALPAVRATRIVGQVAAALDAAHAAGLVHRDVKPANVLLGQDDHVYLTDFGLTKHVVSEAGATRDGHWVGTLDFVAPEQIRGERVDARADVYALGCLLYYALAGRSPFARDSDEAKLWAHLSEPPPRVADVPGAPAELDAVLERALAKSPDDRYPSAGDLGRAAAAVVSGAKPEQRERIVGIGAAAPVEVDTRTAGTWLAAPEAPKRRRGRLGAALAGGLAVAVIAGAASLALRGPAPGERALAAAPAKPSVRSIRIGGRVNAIATAGGRIWAGAFKRPRLKAIDPKRARMRVRPAPDVGIGIAGIAVVGDTMWTIAARDHRLDHFDARTGGRIGKTIMLPGTAGAVAADERTVWVAVSHAEIHSGDQILAYDARTGQLRQTLNVLDGVRRLVLADGGLWMLTVSPARLARIDLRTGKRHRMRFDADAGGDLAAAEGSIWATLADRDQLIRVNPRTWNVTTIAVGREPYGIVERDGSIWVANRTSSTVSRVDPRSGRVRDEIEVPLNPYELAADRYGVWVTSLAKGRITRITAPSG